MAHYNRLFSSILSQIPRHHFENLVRQHGVDRMPIRGDEAGRGWNVENNVIALNLAL